MVVLAEVSRDPQRPRLWESAVVTRVWGSSGAFQPMGMLWLWECLRAPGLAPDTLVSGRSSVSDSWCLWTNLSAENWRTGSHRTKAAPDSRALTSPHLVPEQLQSQGLNFSSPLKPKPWRLGCAQDCGEAWQLSTWAVPQQLLLRDAQQLSSGV